MRRGAAVLLAGGLACALASTGTRADEVVVLWPEHVVNVSTSGDEWVPALAAGPNGEFAVVWQETADFTLRTRLRMRRLDASGRPIGGETGVEEPGQLAARGAVSAGAADGSVVAWNGGHQFDAVHARVFGADGTPLGPAAALEAVDGSSPSVAQAPDGTSLVTWWSATDDGRVLSRRLAADGTALGAAFQVNALTTASGFRPLVARAGGGFRVAWTRPAPPDGAAFSADVVVRPVSDAGVPLASELVVNAYTTGAQVAESIAGASETGRFVVTWSSASASPGPDDAFAAVVARVFEADGTPLTGDFQVNEYSTGDQRLTVAMDGSGAFVVTWLSAGTLLAGPGADFDETSVQARAFVADATPISGELQVNTFTTGGQVAARVAMSEAGRFVVAWDVYPTLFGTDGPDGDGSGVSARTFAIALQADGFESGDLGRWSAPVEP